MQVGISITDIESQLSDEYVLFYRKNNITHLEININDCDYNSYYFTQQFKDRVNDLKKYFSISFHGTIGINYAEKLNRIREAGFEILLDLLKLSDTLEAQWLTIHIGESGGNRENINKRIELFLASYNRMIKNNSIKTKICIENLPKKTEKVVIGDDMLHLERILICTDEDNVGMLLDMGHYYLMHNNKIEDKEMLKKIKGIHLHNNDGISDKHWRIDEGNNDILLDLNNILKFSDDPILIFEYRKFDKVMIKENINYLNKINMYKI